MLHCDLEQMEQIQHELSERRSEVIALQSALVGRKLGDIRKYVDKVGCGHLPNLSYAVSQVKSIAIFFCEMQEYTKTVTVYFSDQIV